MSMNTYLLTWNPQKWRWTDLADLIGQISREGSCVTEWSCGNNKSIAEGERLFLLRQGEEPRGIVGAGWAGSVPFEAVHWRAEKAAAGRTTMYVRVGWEVLLDPEAESIFPREWLNEPPLSRVNWNTQISGIRIRPEAAEALEERWAAFLKGRRRGFSLFSGSAPDEAVD
ncbi:MAG TPA: hypothetical protein VER08_02135 [Pyrinomonadaceae bacterium]|nr:hypothetical protein [Pyrinomonadaceae bacterium]